MKKRAYLVFFLVGLVFLFSIPVTVEAVIFADDALCLFNGEERIRDNSVIVRYIEDGKEYFALCEEGVLWLRQGPAWSPGPYHFYLTSRADNKNFKNWLKSLSNTDCRDTACYQEYLREAIAFLEPVASIIVPEEGSSTPGLDHKKSTRKSIKNKIGDNRYFKVNLKTAAIMEVPEYLD